VLSIDHMMSAMDAELSAEWCLLYREHDET